MLRSFFILPVLLIGCGSAALLGCGSAASTDPGPSGSGGSGGAIQPPSPPTKIGDDAVVVIGVTDDDQIVYRTSEALVAIRMDGTESTPRVISEKGGTVQIKGNTVFLFTDVDWTTNLGELIVWTEQHGPKMVGTAMYGEETALVSGDGGWVAYMNNVTETTADLVVATPDLATKHVVIPAVGRGSETTCRATYGFVKDRLFVAWCTPESLKAKLERFDAPSFEPKTLATDVNTLWAADQTAEKVFYTDPSSGAWYLENGNAVKIDSGVGWGTIVPDGSAVLYTVSDQLRRTALPYVEPTPVVATQFTARAAWSPTFGHSLYSTVVSYEAGTRRDLWLTATQDFNPSPVRLVEGPKAEISRSAFTSDGKWVIYLVDGDDGTKSMFVHGVDGGDPMSVPRADTAIAAHGSRVVFSANRSDPETYPVTADLMVVDPTSPGKPVTLQSGTTDGRSFYLSSDKSKVVYVMPASAEATAAVYVQDVP